MPTDVSSPDQIRALFAKVKETFGRLDLLFNNAGIGAPAVPLEDLPLEKWQAAVEHQSDRPVHLHAGSLQDHEGADPARRPHHQ